jgi:hypothetical protein
MIDFFSVRLILCLFSVDLITFFLFSGGRDVGVGMLQAAPFFGTELPGSSPGISCPDLFDLISGGSLIRACPYVVL